MPAPAPAPDVSSSNSSPGPHVRSKNRAGRWVVIVMVLFGVALTATSWIYWKFHIAPFLPLQQLLADAYPDSRPRVEGGQRKIHKGTPKILRVTMKIEYDPQSTNGKKRVDRFSRQVAAFVQKNYAELADYDLLEINLYWPKAETESKPIEVQREFSVQKLFGK